MPTRSNRKRLQRENRILCLAVAVKAIHLNTTQIKYLAPWPVLGGIFIVLPTPVLERYFLYSPFCLFTFFPKLENIEAIDKSLNCQLRLPRQLSPVGTR